MLQVWLPAALWTGVIVIESFFGSSENTGPILHGWIFWLFGELDPLTLDRLHFIIRKGGHFFGYGILGFLWFRAFAATFPAGGRLAWASLALASTVLIASLDEWNQSFSPARGGHFSDVMLDACGALLLVSMAMVVMRRVR